MILKNKKIWLTLSSVAILFATSSFLIACSSSNTTNISDESNFIIKIPEEIKQRGKEVLRKAAKENKLREASIAILTSNGNVADKSFDQSSFEVSKLIRNTINRINPSRSVRVRPFNTTSAEQVVLNRGYNQALNGENIWIASGFAHAEGLKNWLGDSQNLQRFIDKKILVVAVDWVAVDSASFTWPKGQFISLNFRSQESTYILGYAAAKYLSQTYPKNEDASKRTLVTFGGADFPGVTSFNYGFLEGAIAFNEDAKKANLPTVSWPKEQQKIELNTGFNSQESTANTKVTGALTNGSPSIALPVVGSLLSNVFSVIGKNKLSILVIGVDTDNSIAFPNNAGSIFSSSLKNVASGLWQILVPFLAQETEDKFLEGTNGKTSDLITFKFLNDDQKGQNVSILRGIKENFVGMAPSTIKDLEARKLITQAIQDGTNSLNAKGLAILNKVNIIGSAKDLINEKIIELQESAKNN